MWLRKNIVNGRRYYRIMHSVRKSKKVVSKTLLQIGKLDDKTAELVRLWLKEFPVKRIRK